MDHSVGTADERLQAMVEALRGHGLKVTTQRTEIIREIVHTKDHPDVETVYRRVRERIPAVSLDTVYRTMSALFERGLINKIMADSGRARYDADVSRHNHFVCDTCERIIDIDSSDRGGCRASDRLAEVGVVERVEVLFRGRCNHCGVEPE